MAKYTKAQQVKDLLEALNDKRKGESKPLLKHHYTGLGDKGSGNWLQPIGVEIYQQGDIIVGDDKFIGYLKGLLETKF